MRFLDLMMSFILCQTGWTALHWAAIGGDTDVTRLLLDKGADVNSINKVSDMI